MIKYYFGLDMDNCALNKAFYADAPEPEQRLANKSIIKTNPLLVKHIASQQAEQISGLIASARQDAFTDYMNGAIIDRGNTTSGSCCPYMKQFCEEMGVEFDTFMLGDIAGSEIGNTYKIIMAAIEDGTWNKFPKWKTEPLSFSIDAFKRNIHFAHFQYIANKNMGEKTDIVYDFFDDSYEVLSESIRFYRKNPHLIPEGMTFNVYYYNGSEAPLLLATIIGIGTPYSNYIEVVKEMTATMDGSYSQREQLECIDKYAAENLSPVEDHSAQQETIKKINDSGCYFNLTKDGAEDFLKTNKGRNNFVLRPSSLKVEGMFTFTLSFTLDTDVIHGRFAINQKGRIFSMESNGKLGNKVDISNGIKATFESVINGQTRTKAATTGGINDEKVSRPSPRANQPRLLQPVANAMQAVRQFPESHNTSSFSVPLNKTLFNHQPEIKPQEAHIPVRRVEPKTQAKAVPLNQPKKSAASSPVRPAGRGTSAGAAALLSQPKKSAVPSPVRSAGRGSSAGAAVILNDQRTSKRRPEPGKTSENTSRFFNNEQAKTKSHQVSEEKHSRQQTPYNM